MARKVANWIFKYSDTVEQMSEAPTSYNVWMAISVISAVLKKKVWVNRGLFKIYPNQYIVLVGPPGVGKGTAIHPAHAFVKDPKPAYANYMSDRITAPKIIERLAAGFPYVTTVNGQIHSGTDSSCVLQATELATFLGSSDWMTSFLCDAWDRGEFEYDTKNKGTFTIRDMCVSLIGACVPEFIRTINRDAADAINGGFTARTIFVFANEQSKKIVWPGSFESDLAKKKIKQDLDDDLREIAKLNGEFFWDIDSKLVFEKFYTHIKIEDSDSDVVRHFKARQSTHVLKLAMVLSAASRDDLLIDKYCITTAIALVGQIRDTLDIVFRGVGESPMAEAIARIQTYIERKGITSRSEVLRDNYRHITAEDLERVFAVLQTIGIIRLEHVGGKQIIKHNSFSVGSRQSNKKP